jgi:hypothetical protein
MNGGSKDTEQASRCDVDNSDDNEAKIDAMLRAESSGEEK